MGSQWSVKIEVPVWRGHQCLGCGCLFRYPMVLKASGVHEKQEIAEASGRRDLEDLAARDCAIVPCPTCASIQPEMIAWRTHRLLGLFFLAAVAIWTVACFVAIGEGGLRRGNLLLLAIGEAVLVAVLLYVRFGRVHPTPVGEVVVDQPSPLGGDPSRWLKWKGSWSWHLTVCVLAPILTLSAECTRLVAGWPSNGPWAPTVISPGSTSRWYFSGDLRTVNGLWRGTGSATFAANAEADDSLRSVLTTRFARGDWGSGISVKGRGSSEESTRLWADVDFPDNPELLARPIEVWLSVDAEYPAAVDRQVFEIRRDHRHTKQIVHFAPRGASGVYVALLRIGMVLGATVLAVGVFRFWRRTKEYSVQRGYLRRQDAPGA